VSKYKDSGQQEKVTEEGKNSHIESDFFLSLEILLETGYCTIWTLGLVQHGQAHVCFSTLNILPNDLLCKETFSFC